LLKAYAGMDGELFDAVLAQGADGLVIKALGAGNLPPPVLPSLQRWLDHSIPVLLFSGAFNGIAQDIYDYQGGGKQLKEAGVIFAPSLSGPKARIKLLAVLEQPFTHDEIEAIFAS